MRNFKKLVAIMLCVSMVFGSTLNAFAADDLGTIDDVGASFTSAEEESKELVEESEYLVEEIEENVEASTEIFEEETDNNVGASTEIFEEEIDNNVKASTEIFEEETDNNVGASTASPEEETSEEIIEEVDDNVGESTASSEEESEEEIDNNVEASTEEESEEETSKEVIKETTDPKLVMPKLLTAEPGAIRTLSSGWNLMKGNSYWSSPVTNILSIEFIESNEEFTHEDMYYSWEDKGIRFYMYDMWDTDDHSYTSTGFGAVIQIAEGEILQAAEDASYLFAGIDTLRKIKNIELLDTSNTKNFKCMFEGCNELKELDLSSFDTSSAVTLEGMFKDCSMLNKLDISSFDTSNVKTMASMFKNASSLETIDVSNFDTSNVLKMDYMFATGEKTYDEDFEYQEIPSKFTKIVFGENFKTDNVNNMEGMFYGAAIKKLDLTHFNTSSVTSMCQMFDNCAFLEEVDLSSFDTSNVRDFCAMFADCYRLKSLDLKHFDTAKSEKFRYMFANCYELEEIDVSNFEGSKVDDLCNMFSMDGEATTFVYDDTGYYPIGKTQAESKLKMVDISGIELDVDGVYAYDMFKGARNLTTIYASPKFVNNGRLINYDLFRDCDSLVGGNGTAFDGVHIWSDYAVVDTDETPGYFTDKTKKKFTVTFVTEYGETPDAQTVGYGETAMEPTELSDEDYIFEYWYLNDENVRFNFSEVIKASITLTAKWKSKPTWTVTFKNVKANSEVTKIVKDGHTVDVVEADEVAGYKFEYWYLDDENIEFDYSQKINEDITLFAHYTLENYKITYDLKGGSFVDGFVAKEYITMNETFTLPAANKLTKEEANFLGWYDNEEYSGNAITSIANITSNITLYVKWEDFCIITMNPAPSNIDDDYIIYGDISYDVRIKVGEKYTVPAVTTKAFIYYDYHKYCRILVGEPSDKERRVYYEAYNEEGMYLGKFYGGEEIVISDKKINFKSFWWISGASKITYEEILKQYGEPTKDCPLARQRYNESKKASTTKMNQTTKNTNSGGGSSGGGGGGGGGGSGLSLKGVNPLTAESPLEVQDQSQLNQQAATEVKEAPNAVKTQAEAKTASSASYSVSKESANWTQNADGTWSMSVNNGVGQVAASNGFYSLSDVNATTGVQTKAVYYFDEKGQMATGWVKDAAGSMYFFETANTADVGKMTTGWKQINGGYYYFGSDGKMYTNGVTPDGYKVGADGVWTA